MIKPVVIVVIFVVICHITQARGVRSWSYEELFEASDVVAILEPLAVSNNDTILVDRRADPTAFQGVTTTFLTIATIKAKDKQPTHIDIYHFRYKSNPPAMNAAGLVCFPTKEPSIPFEMKIYREAGMYSTAGTMKMQFLAFLRHDEAGHLVPTSGQYDPILSFMLLSNPRVLLLDTEKRRTK